MEVQFYLLAPVLSMVFAVVRTGLRRIIILAGIALAACFSTLLPRPDENPLHGMNLLYHLQYFLVGFLLVDLYLRSWKEQPRKLLAYDVASLCGWCAIVPILKFRICPWICLPAAIGLAYVGAFRGPFLSRIMTNVFWLPLAGCVTHYISITPLL